MDELIQGRSIESWVSKYPLLKEIVLKHPIFWRNEERIPFNLAGKSLSFTQADVKDAADRLDRFRPYLVQAFPETASKGGEIESALHLLPAMQQELGRRYGSIPGTLFVKLDSHLPISGSVKARGGIYEVLKFAETIALNNGLLHLTDNYEKLDSFEAKELFSRHSIAVGSTGNLGLSIGIIGKRLGFTVTVHMSSDAKPWKKDTLRSIGVQVVEHDADYSVAVTNGRLEAEANPFCHFVDDEDSRDLFLGYAVAGERIKRQFAEQERVVDQDHPLFVYLPCGVGGGPGGITYGLKLAFGDHVHCFFGEPTQAPAMLVGLITNMHDAVSATDFGIENKTIADGLAVSRPSGLVSKNMQHLLSGIFTVDDKEMYALLSLLAECEGIHLEPSALVGFSGYVRAKEHIALVEGGREDNANHLVWATGGSMVPGNVWQEYNEQGKQYLEDSEFV